MVDLSGRPGLTFKIDFVRARIGEFDVDLVHEFFQGFINHALVTLHVDNLKGETRTIRLKRHSRRLDALAHGGGTRSAHERRAVDQGQSLTNLCCQLSLAHD